MRPTRTPSGVRLGTKRSYKCLCAGSVLAACLGACGPTRDVTVVEDVTVRFDSPSDRSPLDGPSARLAAAAKQLRNVLGHPLSIEIDPSLAPQYKDELDAELTRVFEQLATELERSDRRGDATTRAVRERLRRIRARYAPGATREESVPRFEGDGTIVVTLRAKAREIIAVGDVLWLLRTSAERESADAFAKMDPTAVPPAEHGAYVRWLRRASETGTSEPDRKANDLRRIDLALRFTRSVQGDDNRDALLAFLIDGAVRDLAWGRYPEDKLASDVSDAVAAWLERDFDAIGPARRADVLGLLLGRGVRSARLLDCAFALAVRSVDAWRAAGHPLPGPGASCPREFEIAVCAHPKDAGDRRSLAPNCEGGIVRLALATEAGSARLGALLASRRDPILVEHVMVNAGYASYGGGERQLFALLRHVEVDGPSLRAALRVLAEDHVDGANVDVWMTELRRLWLARPAARGTLLYVLAHLDPSDSGKIDFSDFAGDFGAPVSADEAKAYLDEGYRAISLVPIVWPALGRGFSRAALLRPHLDAYLDDPRVRQFSMLDPHEALVRIRHRLCDEAADADLRALSGYFAERVKERPGHGLDDMSKTYDPRTCDPECSGMRGSTCVRGAKARKHPAP